MPIGKPEAPLQKQMFLVSIDGIPNGPLGFSKAGPFKTTRGESSYRPGGQKISEKRHNSTNFEDITIERAASRDNSLYDWFESHSRADDPRSMTVEQLDDAGNSVVLYRIEEARPKEYQGGDPDASSEDVDMETMVLSVRSWERITQ